jgi:hypothetical protein
MYNINTTITKNNVQADKTSSVYGITNRPRSCNLSQLTAIQFHSKQKDLGRLLIYQHLGMLCDYEIIRQNILSVDTAFLTECVFVIQPAGNGGMPV